MAWSSQQLDRLASAPELHISTYREDGTLRKWTPIWGVRVDEDLFIRSAFGSEGGWYRRALRAGRARIQAGGVEADVTLEPVGDAATNERVGAAYEAKYRDQPSGLKPMVAPRAAGSTVRVLEADG